MTISMSNLIITGLGSLFTSIVYLSIGLQKKGIKHYQVLQKRGIKHWLLHIETWEWMIGCVGAALGNILFFALVTSSTFNLLMPLNGVGLVILTIYAVRILDEPISDREYLAIGSIVVGIMVSTLFAKESEQHINTSAFIWMSIFIFGLIAGSVLFRLIKRSSYPAVVESINAGLLAAYSAFMIKNSVFFTQNQFLSYMAIGSFFLFQFLSWIFMQLAYNTGKASTAVPIYTALLIIFPIIGGVMVYQEIVSFFQIIGILLVASGGSILAQYAAIPADQPTIH